MVQSERPDSTIIADPLASHEELLWLKTKEPLTALMHPNCPPDLWWALAELHPLEAQQSVLYLVFTLENPVRWLQLEDNHLERWISEACVRLSEPAQQLFAADCAEHVLYLFEREHPDNDGPREAIRVRRLMARKEISEEEWQEIRKASRAQSPAGFINVSATVSWFAARDASDAATALEVMDAVESAASAVALNTDEHGTRARDLKQLAHIERKWQWKRLQRYLQDDVDASF